MWNNFLAEIVKYLTSPMALFDVKWNLPTFASANISHAAGVFHISHKYFTCPQGQISLWTCSLMAPTMNFASKATFFSEIFGLRRMWNNFLTEIVKYLTSPMALFDVKWNLPTFAKQIFHSVAISHGEAIFHSPKANFTEKKTLLSKTKEFSFLGVRYGIRTHGLQGHNLTR